MRNPFSAFSIGFISLLLAGTCLSSLLIKPDANAFMARPGQCGSSCLAQRSLGGSLTPFVGMPFFPGGYGSPWLTPGQTIAYYPQMGWNNRFYSPYGFNPYDPFQYPMALGSSSNMFASPPWLSPLGGSAGY